MQTNTKFGKNSKVEIVQDGWGGMFHHVLYSNGNIGGNKQIPKSAFNEWLVETGRLNCDFTVNDGNSNQTCECTMTIEDYYRDVPWKQRYADIADYLLLLDADLSELYNQIERRA